MICPKIAIPLGWPISIGFRIGMEIRLPPPGEFLGMLSPISTTISLLPLERVREI
jgi:hypothetical protein